MKRPFSASVEDYLKIILEIRAVHGEVRAGEIKRRLKVTGPSVTEACQLLRDKGLIDYAPYEAISLTPAGERIARDVQARHATLRSFFIEVLGLEPEVADRGACRMEHALSPPVAERIVAYHHYLTRLEAEGILSRLDFLTRICGEGLESAPRTTDRTNEDPR
jgi:DtxR family transcriptional regulator, Mn-dependent transcriptional regulator